jgi:hypothetical protein
MTRLLRTEADLRELVGEPPRPSPRRPSTLWDFATWPAKGEVPSAGQMVRSQHNLSVAAEEIDTMLDRDTEVNRY